MTTSLSRLPLIDALKAAASQLIVLHHLAFYGPMSEAAQALAPAVLGWLSDHARVAVQVFLVVGGFLSARSLAPHGKPNVERPLALIWGRYVRLVLPYMAAIGFAVFGAAVARAWVQLESAPAPATAEQLFAHLLLLQNLLGYEALSAGVWYVAIDFQLYALMVGLLWACRKMGPGTGSQRLPTLVCVLAITMVSLFHFNRNAAWDIWAIYFFGAYGLGVMAFWASRSTRAAFWLGVIAAIGLAALLVDFRIRIAAALLTALLLGLAGRQGTVPRWLEARPLAFLGRISYSVFLVHYPVSLLVNAAFARFAADSPPLNALGLVLAWGACISAGALFHRHVEQATEAWQRRIAVGWFALVRTAAR